MLCLDFGALMGLIGHSELVVVLLLGHISGYLVLLLEVSDSVV